MVTGPQGSPGNWSAFHCEKESWIRLIAGPALLFAMQPGIIVFNDSNFPIFIKSRAQIS
jgi:hypothetical protein